MGLPISKLVVATNISDILHRLWQTDPYEKQPVMNSAIKCGLLEDGVRLIQRV